MAQDVLSLKKAMFFSAELMSLQPTPQELTAEAPDAVLLGFAPKEDDVGAPSKTEPARTPEAAPKAEALKWLGW